jgi:iron complex outermembrane receptor protein
VNIAAVDGSPVLYTKEAPFTSPWQATAIVRYDWPMFGGVMALQGDAKYVDTYFLSLTNFTATRQDGYTLIDANLSWTNRDEKLTISLSGSNLTDVRYKTVGFDTAAFLKFEQVAYGKPLWIDANIAYHF